MELSAVVEVQVQVPLRCNLMKLLAEQFLLLLLEQAARRALASQCLAVRVTQQHFQSVVFIMLFRVVREVQVQVSFLVVLPQVVHPLKMEGTR